MKTTPLRSAPAPEKNSTPAKVGSARSFPVVAVGASAGGLDAFIEFFRSLPVDTGMAYVVIQHLEPSHQSLLTEILSKASPYAGGGSKAKKKNPAQLRLCDPA